MSMKNITLSVDAEVLAAVRRYAADRNASVNAIVRDFLSGIAGRHDRARKARRRIQQLSEQSKARIGPREWSRDALHER